MPRRNRDDSDLPPRAFYYIEEVAALMGLSTWSAYEANKRDEIPGAERIGNAIRISKAIFNAAYGIVDDEERTG